jgi:hypothetical protein
VCGLPEAGPGVEPHALAATMAGGGAVAHPVKPASTASAENATPNATHTRRDRSGAAGQHGRMTAMLRGCSRDGAVGARCHMYGTHGMHGMHGVQWAGAPRAGGLSTVVQVTLWPQALHTSNDRALP